MSTRTLALVLVLASFANLASCGVHLWAIRQMPKAAPVVESSGYR